jgi:hypothetical protein
MEGLIGILILGFCLWMIIRHPLKSLGCILKIGFLFILGIGLSLVALYFGMSDMIENEPPTLNLMETVFLTSVV